MINIASADINAWLAAFLWPLARILGMFTAAPVFGNQSLPIPVKVGLALLITFAVAPMLPALPRVDPASGDGLLILAEQALIGLTMGYAMSIAFAAVDMAGELIGLEMGLGFASFYDPRGTDNPILAAFLGLMTTLVFLSIDGHLMMIALLADSFQALPIASGPIAAKSMHTLALWGGKIFLTGLLLSLPLLAALLVTNLALGVLTRAAPQLNLFAIGFPITLGIGLAVLALSLPYFLPSLERLFQDGFDAMLRVAGDARPSR